MSRKKADSPPHLLSPEDQNLWYSVAKSITPMKGRRSGAAPSLPLLPEGVTVRPVLAEPPRPKDKTAASKTLSPQHTASDVDASTLKKFSRGEMPIAARLDLHGYTQDQAYEALNRFVRLGYHNGRRCVLIITGRSGVLKRLVPEWINTDELRPYILALSPAKNHGGEGALYVLLKRRR